MLLKLPFCKTAHEVHLNRQESYNYNQLFIKNKQTINKKFQL